MKEKLYRSIHTENDMAGVCCGVSNGSQIELQIFGPKLCRGGREGGSRTRK